MRTLIQLAVAFSVGLGFVAPAAGSGGRIVGTTLTNAQMGLLFESTGGYVYQVQTSQVASTRFWRDAVPMTNATTSLTRVWAPAAGTIGFFKVLELTNWPFWYDWKYYYQAPTLSTWGVGVSQSSYDHSDRAYEWYIDQADTGPDANNNCGPSSVTMAIKWYDSTFSKTAEDARNTYPEDHGWWYTDDIINYLNLYGIPNTTSAFTGPDQLAGLLSQGNVVILCITTAYLTQDYSSEHRVGRFYSFAGGHFVVVKGCRSVDSSVFFETYDPNNWHALYADTTPKGRNRHYLAADLAAAIGNWWNYLIVIPPPPGAGESVKANRWLQPVDPAHIVHMPGR